MQAPASAGWCRLSMKTNMECHEHDSRLVRKPMANGNSHLTWQCQNCGQIDYSKTVRGPWVAKPAGVDIQSLPAWDDGPKQAGSEPQLTLWGSA